MYVYNSVGYFYTKRLYVERDGHPTFAKTCLCIHGIIYRNRNASAVGNEIVSYIRPLS